MPSIDHDKLHAAFEAAAEAGRTANPGDDGGTCNLDTAVLFLPHAMKADLEAAAVGTGIRLSDRKWMGRECFFIYADDCGGQGFARTRSAEAIERSLAHAGFRTSVYYQID